ncbi:uncharacterized protein [Ptychodera flava]|uniref:uncharacterized protein n=1 Tax=Ptychodera flava TaxID=63121 RepID=UPI00396AA663
MAMQGRKKQQKRRPCSAPAWKTYAVDSDQGGLFPSIESDRRINLPSRANTNIHLSPRKSTTQPTRTAGGLNQDITHPADPLQEIQFSGTLSKTTLPPITPRSENPTPELDDSYSHFGSCASVLQASDSVSDLMSASVTQPDDRKDYGEEQSKFHPESQYSKSGMVRTVSPTPSVISVLSDIPEDLSRGEVIVTNIPSSKTEADITELLERKGFVLENLTLYFRTHKAYVRYSVYPGSEDFAVYGREYPVDDVLVKLCLPDNRRLLFEGAVSTDQVQFTIKPLLQKHIDQLDLNLSIRSFDEIGGQYQSNHIVTFKKSSTDLDALITSLGNDSNTGIAVSWQRIETTDYLALSGLEATDTLEDVRELGIEPEVRDVIWSNQSGIAILIFINESDMEKALKYIRRKLTCMFAKPHYLSMSTEKMISTTASLSFNGHIFNYINSHREYRVRVEEIISQQRGKIVTEDDDGNIAMSFNVFGTSQRDYLDMLERKQSCKALLDEFQQTFSVEYATIPDDLDIPEQALTNKLEDVKHQATEVEVIRQGNRICLVGKPNSVSSAKITLDEYIIEECSSYLVVTGQIEIQKTKWRIIQKGKIPRQLPGQVVIVDENVSTVNPDHVTLTLKGHRKDISNANEHLRKTICREIFEAWYNISEEYKRRIPKSLNIGQYLKRQITDHGATETDIRDGSSVVVMGTAHDLTKTMTTIKQILNGFKAVTIAVRQPELLEKQLLQQKISSYRGPDSSDLEIIISSDKDKILIRGTYEKVNSCMKDLQNFITDHEIREVLVRLQSEKIRYLLRYRKKPFKKIEAEFSAGFVEICGNQKHTEEEAVVKIKGTTRCLNGAKTRLEEMVNSVLSSSLKVKGKEKLFRDGDQSVLIKEVENKFECVLRVIRKDEIPNKDDQTAETETAMGGEPGCDDDDVYDTLETEGNARITLVKGNLTQQSVDVIVNSTSSDLKFNAGVSNTMSKAAGPNLKKVCAGLVRSHNGRLPGLGIDTPGYNLPCKKIYHAFTPAKDDTEGLRAVVNSALDFASKGGYHSICLPAIGTGVNNSGKHIVAKCMYDQAVAFSEQNAMSQLKDIRFVVFDSQTIKAFEEELNSRLGRCTQPETSSDVKASTPAPLPQTPRDIKVGSILLDVFEGDILQETVDAVVNTISGDLGYGTLGRRIIQQGGDVIDGELKEQGEDKPKDLVYITGAGAFKYKKIFHMKDCQGNELTKAVSDCLKMADIEGIGSIAIPAIGTGAAKHDVGKVAQSMIRGVIDYATTNQPKNLQRVRIVIWPTQPSQFPPFLRELQDKGYLNTLSPASVVAGSVITSGVLEDEDSRYDTEVLEFAGKVLRVLSKYTVKNYPSFEILIFSDDQQTINSVKREIQQRVEQDKQDELVLTNGLIGQLADTAIQQLTTMAARCDLTVTVDKGKSVMNIKADEMNENIKKEIENLDTETQNEQKRRQREKKAEILYLKEKWYWIKVQTDEYVEFTASDGLVLHECYGKAVRPGKKKKSKHSNLSLLGQSATVEIGAKSVMKIGNETFPLTRRKGDELLLPPHWEPNQQTDVHVSDITNKESMEYKEVYELFFSTLDDEEYEIENLQRVQIPWRYKQYQTSKEKFNRKNPGCENEKRLFHGTRAETLKEINRSGFNRSYAGLNATVYGQGSYFARDASYSEGFAPPDNGVQYMYCARVLVGRYARGDTSMREPPRKADGTPYDSTVDDDEEPSIFVVYDDTYAYPEYIIKFKAVQ